MIYQRINWSFLRKKRCKRAREKAILSGSCFAFLCNNFVLFLTKLRLQITLQKSLFKIRQKLKTFFFGELSLICECHENVNDEDEVEKEGEKITKQNQIHWKMSRN